jgi:hypothetical protein
MPDWKLAASRPIALASRQACTFTAAVSGWVEIMLSITP